MLSEISAVIISYLIGSISPGYFLYRIIKHSDIRKTGNTGATNVFRQLGPFFGILTGVLDVLKGLIAVFISFYLTNSELIFYLSGLAAILGHNYPFYLQFKGGRGVAAFLGVAIGSWIFHHDKISVIATILLIVYAIVVSGNFRKRVKQLFK